MTNKKLCRIGNSTGLILKKTELKRLQAGIGDVITITEVDGGYLIQKAQPATETDSAE